jgi:hypothetical protein
VATVGVGCSTGATRCRPATTTEHSTHPVLHLRRASQRLAEKHAGRVRRQRPNEWCRRPPRLRPRPDACETGLPSLRWTVRGSGRDYRNGQLALPPAQHNPNGPASTCLRARRPASTQRQHRARSELAPLRRARAAGHPRVVAYRRTSERPSPAIADSARRCQEVGRESVEIAVNLDKRRVRASAILAGEGDHAFGVNDRQAGAGTRPSQGLAGYPENDEWHPWPCFPHGPTSRVLRLGRQRCWNMAAPSRSGQYRDRQGHPQSAGGDGPPE